MNVSTKAFAVLGAFALPAGPAFACSTLAEGFLIQIADVVVDGTATCDAARASCLLRAREVIKDEAWRADHRRLYRFHYEPGANEQLRRDFEETGVLIMCVNPWEPVGASVDGRFYLRRDRGRLYSRQESARGGPKPDEEAAE